MATTKSKTELFDVFVGNLASHAANLMTQKGRIRMSAVVGMDMIEFFVEQKGEKSDVWDQCYLVRADGTREWLGNRHGMIQRYAQACAEALRTFAGVEAA